MHLSRREAIVLIAAVSAFALGLVLLLVGAIVLRSQAPAQLYAAVPASGDARASSAATDSTTGQWVATADVPTLSALSTPAAGTPVITQAAPDPSQPAAGGPASIDAYHGLGSWVDLYDTRAWADPAGAVADMAAHGVRTIYIETSNYHSPAAVMNADKVAAFITNAHARGMKVVAWYLPDLKANSVDFDRVSKAIAFSTPDGQKFDSFALDIEATVVGSESQRNRNLTALSTRIRGLVGASYPLGGIIPSPVGLSKKAGYWDNFPYSVVANSYDVIVPMAYYTYHGKGAAAAYADATANVRILRAQPGCATVPVHLIGGIAENSSPAEVGQFVRAAREGGCAGASLYGWAGTSAADWQQLASAPR